MSRKRSRDEVEPLQLRTESQSSKRALRLDQDDAKGRYDRERIELGMSEVLPGLWIGSEKAKHSVLGKQEFFGLGFKNVLNLTESSRRHRVDLRSALIRNNGETNVALRDVRIILVTYNRYIVSKV